MTRQTLVGRLGVVVHAVRGGALAGEIRVVMHGIAHYLIAYSVEPVSAGTHVLIIHSRGSRQVDVEPWDQRGDIADVSIDL